MRFNRIPMFVLGASAMLAMSAIPAGAQSTDSTRTSDTTAMRDSTHTRHHRRERRRAGSATSETRIRTTKTAVAAGEVGTRVDTVTVTRVDTVTVNNGMARVDTVTVTRVDTVQLQPPPRLMRYPTGLYFGVGGGVSLPTGAMYTPNATGMAGQGQLGIKSFSMPLGLRVDANYLRAGQDSYYSGLADDAQLWNFNGDVTLDLPFVNHMFGLSPRFGVYLMGGPSYSRWRDVFIDQQPGTVQGYGPANVVYSRDWQAKWGWNAGGGASLSFGRTEIFAESRLISFTYPNAPTQARQVPFIVGVNLFSGAVSR